MSYIPIKTTESIKNITEKKFFGLNRTEQTSMGQFCDMKNLSSEQFPYISSRAKRSKATPYNTIYTDINNVSTAIEISNVRATISLCEDSIPMGFCGVIGTKFYYNGYEKAMKVPAVRDNLGNYKYGMEIDAGGKIQLLWANRIIIIHGYDCEPRKPYIYYYDTQNDDNLVQSYEYALPSYYTERTIDLMANGCGRINFTYKCPNGSKSEYFDFKVGDSVFIDGMMSYSDSKWEKLSKDTITSAIVLSYRETISSTSAGYENWDINLEIKFLNQKGDSPFDYAHAKTVDHIYKKIPYMTNLTLHKGRLWGANPNGEYVYASALGDLFCFNRFEGLSDDSVYLESSSQGGYVGVISCGESLVTLKKNELEVIYGELPSEFAVGKRYLGYGCCDINSCAVIDNILYFLDGKGFYTWSGTRPQCISKCLECEYTGAFGFSDGIKYFASAKYGDNKFENLVFDTRYGLWMIEDICEISGYFRSDNKSYILVNHNEIKEINSGTEIFEWYADSVGCFFEDNEQSRISEIWIRAKLYKNSEMEIYTSTDNGEWKRCDGIKSEENNAVSKTYRISVRISEGNFWQYRIKGKGKVLIYSLKILYDRGGCKYSNERIE